MYCGYFAYRKGWHGGGIVSDAVHRKGCSPGGGQRSVCESGGAPAGRSGLSGQAGESFFAARTACRI